MLNESIKMALQGMVSNKLRTFLTLLGIIIGVGAVIAMVSLGFGLKENVKSNISKLGSNLLIITSGGRTSTGARLAAGEGVKLTYDDMQAIGKQVDGIANITASVNRSYQMVAGNQNWTSRVEGTTPSNFTISSLEVDDGRILNDRDLISRGRVAVIGKTVADSLFPEGNPVGKIMRINKAPFQVVGVLKSKGQGSMGMDQDDVVYVPLTTAQNRMMGITNVQRITVQAENENIINDVQADVEQVLRTRHKIKEGANDDFTVGNMAQIMETMMETANNITILLGCIAAISLLVGGIGIMNIMLVSVTERTREIGIRKALGLYCNLRPMTVSKFTAHLSPLKTERAEGADLLIVRELTGGIYFGEHNEAHLNADGVEEASDVELYTRPEVERIARFAFEAAKKRRGKVTSVDKANVLGSSRMWRKIVAEMQAKDYPEIELNNFYVDNCAMQLVLNPKQFDVILTNNIFGDILSDEASTIAGSIGLLPSASLGDGTGMYEPIHGSAPDIAGQGIANPLATILSVAMMLRYSLNQNEAADAMEAAVDAVMEQGYRTPDLYAEGLKKVSTSEMGHLVAQELLK